MCLVSAAVPPPSNGMPSERPTSPARAARDVNCFCPAEVHLEANRSGIRHHYSRIPLHIMTRFARESGIDVGGKLEDDEAVPDSLSTIQQRIEAYIARIGNGSNETDWQHNEEWLRQLRHDYLHFSAKYAIGMKPRFGDSGQRKRKYFDG